jgi:predicted transcriptional regulator
LGAVGLIERVEIAEPKQIWLKHGQHAAISECEFEEYFKGAKIGTAIVFRKVLPITQSIGLQEIRDQLGEFYPPQFMRRLHRDAPELAMFNAALEPAS